MLTVAWKTKIFEGHKNTAVSKVQEVSPFSSSCQQEIFLEKHKNHGMYISSYVYPPCWQKDSSLGVSRAKGCICV